MPHTEDVLNDEEAANLGVGVSFLELWDFELVNGSIGLIDGLNVLGRDIGFAVHQVADDDIRGELFNPGHREDIRVTINNVASRDSRVSEVNVTEISKSNELGRSIDVKFSITAITDEKGEFIVSV